MATVAENLATRRANIAAFLASLTCGENLDGPDHTGEAAIQRTAKIRAYTEELKALDELIRVTADPVEVVTYGIV